MSLSAFVAALIADEGLLSTMLYHVLFEATILCAGELTLVTGEVPLSVVR